MRPKTQSNHILARRRQCNKLNHKFLRHQWMKTPSFLLGSCERMICNKMWYHKIKSNFTKKWKMTVYSAKNAKVLILQKIYILKFVKGFCTWWNFCHFMVGECAGLIITHRFNNDDSVEWGSTSIFSPVDLFFTHWKKKTQKRTWKGKTYPWRKKKCTCKYKNPKKCLLKSQNMSIKTKKWSEQSERVCVKTIFPFVKVKHKVKKWLFMFNGENNTGL